MALAGNLVSRENLKSSAWHLLIEAKGKDDKLWLDFRGRRNQCSDRTPRGSWRTDKIYVG